MTHLLIKSSLIAGLMFLSGDFIHNNSGSSCCAAAGGKCTGSAYCSACTNCSRCGHCNSGGSCGVCAGRSTSPSYPNNSGNRSNSSPVYSNPSNQSLPSNYSSSNLKLVVTAQELKLRSGPGTGYEVIENLTIGDQVKYISKDADWIKVISDNSMNIGYVYYKYVKFIE